ncbi:3-deoxy-D-manno-octulosonic acid transferase [Robiginitomaculum antarcticum]|uniref:3-deoxy-D-manno-octulosonic acid transferase n=1 Tax=Robiginitomaculum antarcticum TaxID=437507 RepID=UPI000362B92E|nr:3-deoxy-D-manno-octulosonic acid transferase [Robiginitomaculum antarcticum]
MSAPVSYVVYRAAAQALSLFAKPYLQGRAKKDKEDIARLPERFGAASRLRPDGPLIWVHGASVGESVMMLPLINRLVEGGANVLITTGTVTSAMMMQARLPKGAIHQYVPLDAPKFAKKFLDYWRPDLALWAESEIWPNLLSETSSCEIPALLVNARMSEKSLSGWAKRRSLAKFVFGHFRAVLAADHKTAAGLSGIFGRAVPVFGNLKHAGAPLPVDTASLAAHRAQLTGRPVWCAASTHEGEEDIILAAHRAILAEQPDALLILAPRHPGRGRAIEALIDSAGLKYNQTGYAEDILPDTQIMLVAKMGQLGLAYRLANIACVCGSLLPDLSGHNPLEPARLDCAVLTGPYVDSFDEVYHELSAAGAMQTVRSAEGLAERVIELWEDETRREAQILAATTFTAAQDDILDTVWTAIAPFFPQGVKL